MFAETEVTIRRVPELVPEEVARKAGAKLEQAALDRESRRASRVRRDHFWHAHALRQYVRADAQLSGSDWRTLDEWRSGR